MSNTQAIDVMLDLETLGTHPGDVILSVGAVPFNYSCGNTDKPFPLPECYEKISIADSITNRLNIDPDTAAWWAKQDPAVRDEAFSGIVGVRDVLSGFAGYLRELGDIDSIYIWGKGADFDPIMLAAAYDALQLQLPWKFRNVRCFRTLAALFPQVTHEYIGTKHSAIDDARNQARHAEKIFQHIEEMNETVSLYWSAGE